MTRESDQSSNEVQYILDGEVQIFKRPGSPYWQMRCSYPNIGQKRVSLRVTDLAAAKSKARKLYHKISGRIENGLAASAKPFADIAREFLEEFRVQVVGKTKTEKDFANAKNIVERYFLAFWNEKDIEKISEADIETYKSWRESYWITGPGKSIQFIEYVRNGKVIKRRIKRKVPSISRQRQEISLLRQVFQHAYKRKYLQKHQLPEITSPALEDTRLTRRTGFTSKEVSRLLEGATKRIFEAKAKHTARQRWMLKNFIGVAIGTGMRPTELYRLSWGDIEGLEESFEAAVKEKNIVINAHGKKKERRVIPLSPAITAVESNLEMWKNERGCLPDPHDPIFFDKSGRRIKSFKKGLANLLDSAGLRTDLRGRSRDSFDFRHYYISEMKRKGIDTYLLGENVGTSEAMIRKFYSHVTTDELAALLKTNWDEAK